MNTQGEKFIKENFLIDTRDNSDLNILFFGF